MVSILNLYIQEELEDFKKQFIREAIKGNIDEAKKIITEDASVVNFQDEATGISGLMIFAGDGCYTMVDYICGVPEVDVTLQDVHGRSAGIMALTIGRQDIMLRIGERMNEDIDKFDPDLSEGSNDKSNPSAKIIPFGKPKPL